MDDDEQFEQAFGDNSGLQLYCKVVIEYIKNNNGSVIEFDAERSTTLFSPPSTDQFTDLAWRLLGRYISNNTHLKRITLNSQNLTDKKMGLLFSELERSVSLNKLDMSSNVFGIEGMRSMVSFLQNSLHLKSVWLEYNPNIDSECFELLINALQHIDIEEIRISRCNITDISALGTYTLPNLQKLSLYGNNIGKDGCTTLSTLLQEEASTLKYLNLENTGIGDDEAGILAISLKRNTKLEMLALQENNITKKGLSVFLKLLVDVSSIENTYNSNHTLSSCIIDAHDASLRDAQTLLNRISDDNKDRYNLLTNKGRTKVIEYQLNSRRRKKLCEAQGIDYSSGNIFADIEPILLPNILH